MDITSLETGPFLVNTIFLPASLNRLVIIDPGGNIEEILTHIRSRKEKPSLILLTHGHFDHLIALPPLYAAYPEIEIAIHHEDAQWLGRGAIEKHAQFFRILGAESLVRRYSQELPAPTQILKEGNPIRLKDGDVFEDWEVLWTPGHSPGSICLYNKEASILISGDTIFNGGIGRTDTPGGCMNTIEKSLTRLSKLPHHTRVIPGHGLETTIGNEFVF